MPTLFSEILTESKEIITRHVKATHPQVVTRINIGYEGVSLQCWVKGQILDHPASSIRTCQNRRLLSYLSVFAVPCWIGLDQDAIGSIQSIDYATTYEKKFKIRHTSFLPLWHQSTRYGDTIIIKPITCTDSRKLRPLNVKRKRNSESLSTELPVI